MRCSAEAALVVSLMLWIPPAIGAPQFLPLDDEKIDDLGKLTDFSDLISETKDEPHKRAAEPITGDVINMCYVCDVNCRQDLGVSDATAFMNDLSARTSEILWNLHGKQLTVKHLFTLQPNRRVYLWWYTGGDDSSSSLGTASKGFFRAYDLYKVMRRYGCEAAFYIGYHDDIVFRFSGDDGIANMMALCTDNSYGVVRVQGSLATMATVLAHELGHLMGIWHDGNLVSRFLNPSLEPYFPSEIALLKRVCPDEAVCPEDPTHLCVMHSVPVSALGCATHYSNCSRAYEDFWHAVVLQFPAYADDSCLDEGSRKRRSIAGPDMPMLTGDSGKMFVLDHIIKKIEADDSLNSTVEGKKSPP